MQEVRTAKIASDYLTNYQFEVTTGIGGTGVVGMIKTGEGPVVMLRVDMDALTIAEATGNHSPKFAPLCGSNRQIL